MSIIVVEGPDGSGKTRLIHQSVGKYPDHFDSMAFPTEIFKNMVDEELTTIEQHNPLSRLIHYHTAFEIDFMVLRDEIEKRSRKRVLLLDRYYMSNIVYAAANFKKHGYENHQFLYLLRKIDRGIIPDCVLFLRMYDCKNFPAKEDSHFTSEEFNTMQYEYSLLLHQLRDEKKIKCFETILTLSEQSRTKGELFDTVEKVLIERGFI